MEASEAVENFIKNVKEKPQFRDKVYEPATSFDFNDLIIKYEKDKMVISVPIKFRVDNYKKEPCFICLEETKYRLLCRVGHGLCIDCYNRICLRVEILCYQIQIFREHRSLLSLILNDSEDIIDFIEKEISMLYKLLRKCSVCQCKIGVVAFDSSNCNQIMDWLKSITHMSKGRTHLFNCIINSFKFDNLRRNTL